ncbi:hypothetical protein VTK73DRAFT_4646 [Phialemonium thermophilum]|uniref:DUF7704 domain-containing protein n=1 Tax=Phialemonium thermophilum TaxID=223376 RepID=A0ABR3V811_9PEZI
MASTLSAWPLFLFGVVEPALLVWAFVVCVTDPFRYYAGGVPTVPLRESDFQPQARAMTFQTGNILLLLAALAVVCCWTPRAATKRWYLVAVALADYGHIYGTYLGLGPEAFWDVSQWNDAVWGAVGVSGFLNVFRWLTVLGVFGGLRDVREGGAVGTKRE